MCPIDNYGEVLRHEFCSGHKETFLIQMRPRLRWDKEAFSRLIQAMQACCEAYDRSETMETWLAEGFYMMAREVRHWTTHPNFPKEHPEDYYQKAYIRLDDLAYWFFIGDRLYVEGRGYEPL